MRLYIKTITAMTNRIWISPPPKCPMNPSNHKISKITKIVHNIISLSFVKSAPFYGLRNKSATQKVDYHRI